VAGTADQQQQPLLLHVACSPTHHPTTPSHTAHTQTHISITRTHPHTHTHISIAHTHRTAPTKSTHRRCERSRSVERALPGSWRSWLGTRPGHTTRARARTAGAAGAGCLTPRGWQLCGGVSRLACPPLPDQAVAINEGGGEETHLRWWCPASTSGLRVQHGLRAQRMLECE
jgi:hypothetical protein